MTIKNLNDMPYKNWSGGKTIELFRDQTDFNIRISCAYIDAGESSFSDFSGYKRILHILEGKTALDIQGEKVLLREGQDIYFDGSQKVTSKNDIEVLDFNIIYRSDTVKVDFYRKTKEISLQKVRSMLIFSKEDGTRLYLGDKRLILNKNDFILFDSEIGGCSIEGEFLAVTF